MLLISTQQHLDSYQFFLAITSLCSCTIMTTLEESSMTLDLHPVKDKPMSISHSPYVRCFWTGSLYLTNGVVMPIHCTHISTQMIEVEAPDGLQGSKLVKLELKAIHEGKTATIKALCDPQLDVFNEHNKHYIKFTYHTISNKDVSFIKEFVDAHS